MREISYRQALNEAIQEEMERDPSVFYIGEDVGAYGGVRQITKGLQDRFGEKRVKDTPISEAAIVGLGTGAAIMGLRPIVEIMSIDFATVAMDQICNQAAKLRYMTGGILAVPLVIRTEGGSGSGEAAQHCQSLEAWFVHTPGLKVVMPSTPYDTKGLFKTSVRDNNPVIFIGHKLLYPRTGPVPEGEYTIPFGQAKVVREGKDITVVATSLMVHRALEAARVLEQERISLEIVDPRTLVPFDSETILNSVKRTGHLAIVHEACLRGGIGGDIARQMMKHGFDYLDGPIEVVAGKDIPIPYERSMEESAVPQVRDIVDVTRQML